MVGDLEIELLHGEVVLLDGRVHDGESVGAGGALEILVLDDGNFGAGGWLQLRGVALEGDLVGGNRSLGAGDNERSE